MVTRVQPKTNLFILDGNPTICARYLSDIHLARGIVQVAQVLSTVVRTLIPMPNRRGGALINSTSDIMYGTSRFCPDVYKANNLRGANASWIIGSSSAYDWVVKYYENLLEEYELRFGKSHLTGQKIPASIFENYRRNFIFVRRGGAEQIGAPPPPILIPMDIQLDTTAPTSRVRRTAQEPSGGISYLLDAADYFVHHPSSTWSDVVFLYRKYYCIKKFEHGFWTGRDVPYWYREFHEAKGAEIQSKPSKNPRLGSTASFMYYPSGDIPNEIYQNSINCITNPTYQVRQPELTRL